MNTGSQSSRAAPPDIQKALHHIIMRRRAPVILRAVFFHRLIDLEPQAGRLFHKALAHRHIGGLHRVFRCGVLRQKSVLRDVFLALNPPGYALRVLLYDLSWDQMRTAALIQPLPSVLIKLYRQRLPAVFCAAARYARGGGISWPARSAVSLKSTILRGRFPGLPSKILSWRGFFFDPVLARAPPLLVPSFAIHIPPNYGAYIPV